MIHGLPAVIACIDHRAVAVGESFFSGDLLSFDQEVAEEGVVLGGGVCEFRDVLFGDDQDVGGRLGGDVPEGEAEIVFVDDVGGDFFAEDFAEEGWISFGADVRV